MRSFAAALAFGATLVLTASACRAGDAAPSATLKFGDLPVELTLTELKRTDDGTTLTLHAVATNSSDRAVDLGTTSEMYLVDFRNRMKHMVILDSSLACLCSPGGGATVPASGSLHLWAKFPAPPESVTAMSFGWNRAEPTSIGIGR